MSVEPMAPTERHARPVTPPRVKLPADAWDCHAHVFGPWERFPLLPDRRWSPPLSPAEDYLAMLDTVGFSRGVTVQSWVNGFDNGGPASAFHLAPQRVRGCAVVRPDAPAAAWRRLHDEGFRAVRFTETGRPTPPGAGTLNLPELQALLPRLREMGWQAHIWARAADTLAAAPWLATSGVPVVLDHMGYFDVAKGVADPGFRDLLLLARDAGFWVKLTPVRVTQQHGIYADVRPFHDAWLEAVPDRAVFGSDWPYISLDDAPPDAGKLVDLFDAWTPDATLRHKVFVENPARLFG